MSGSSEPPNLTVYQKLNEAIEVINAQSQYIREIDSLFRTIANDHSISGWIARRVFQQYVSRSKAPSIVGIRPVDIPPVYPGTLEIVKENDDGRIGRSRKPRSV